MSKRADVLQQPVGLDEVGAERWRIVAPILWKQGLLTTDTRDDIEWDCRLHSRLHVLNRRPSRDSSRSGTREDQIGDMEGIRVLRLISRLEYRYGLNALGRRVMADRGHPGTLNPLDEDMLDSDEQELELPFA